MSAPRSFTCFEKNVSRETTEKITLALKRCAEPTHDWLDVFYKQEAMFPLPRLHCDMIGIESNRCVDEINGVSSVGVCTSMLIVVVFARWTSTRSLQTSSRQS